MESLRLFGNFLGSHPEYFGMALLFAICVMQFRQNTKLSEKSVDALTENTAIVSRLSTLVEVFIAGRK